MRKYRMGLIQTPDQLRFSYQAIIEGAKQLSQPPCDDTEVLLIQYIFIFILPDFFLFQNCNSDHIEPYGVSSDEDEPPPPPPPRGESLARSYMTERPPVDRPLPKIPNSASLNDFAFENDAKDGAPSRPLPIIPTNNEVEEEDITSSDDELETSVNNSSLDQGTRYHAIIINSSLITVF